MRLHVTITAETGRAYVPFLRAQIKRAHATLVNSSTSPRRRLALRELSLALVGDRRMSDLHVRFMNIAGPTDVLTFPIDETEAGEVLSGEVILCVPEARRRGADHKIEPKLELLLYAVHGMLHLLGYDDRTDRAFRTMHRTEDDILTKLGFGPVFSAAAAAARPGRAERAAAHRSPGGRR